jgi:L-amino acid N-acyltransferase YncA
MKTNNYKIVPITKEDLMSVYELSNQKAVRANSFNSSKIELADHLKWFKNKLADPDTLMFKLLSEEKFAGQMRLVLEKTDATISLSVDENFQGRGFGSALVKFAIDFLKKNKPEVKQIIAEIKPSNLASVALFKKFAFIKQSAIGDCLTFTHNLKNGN